MHRALAAALMLPALAGCLAPAAPLGATEGGAPALPDVAMEGARVVARDASSVTLAWEGQAPLAAGAPLGPGVRPEVRKAFELPAGLHLRLNATLAWGGGDVDLDLRLRDERGAIRCAAPDAPGEEACGAVLWQTLDAPQPWEAGVLAWHNTAPGAPFTVTLRVEAIAMPEIGVDLARLTRPVHEALPKAVDYAPASLDGALLYTEVYLPEGEGPWPAILILSPYYDHGVPLLGRGVDVESGFRAYYVPRGYAVVVADVRGTGNSEGCMDMMGAKEQRDAHDLVEWVAAQPWSDGKVGMWGVSYVGTTPHMAAIMAPPHLAAIVTVAGVTNQWRNMFLNGVPIQGRSYPLGYELGEGLPPPGDVERGPAWAANAAAGACDQEEAVAHVAPGTYGKGLYDAYWAERNLTTRVAEVRVPVFYSQGFQDRLVTPEEALHWFNELPAPKKGLFHQGFHQLPPRADFAVLVHAWFDRWLRGIDNGIEATPTVEVVTNLDTFRADAAWPPAGAAARRLYLGPEGLTGAPPAEGAATYLADTARTRHVVPVAFAGGAAATATALAADLARNADPALASAGLPTSLEFLGPPLEAPLHLAGVPTARLRAASDAENTYFLLSLFDVGPEGRWVEVAEGWFNAHLREGFDRSAPLVPGQAYDFHFKFQPREYVFEAGHRVGLRVLGHDSRVYPFDQPVSRNTLHYGAEGSLVDLPALDAPATRARPADL